MFALLAAFFWRNSAACRDSQNLILSHCGCPGHTHTHTHTHTHYFSRKKERRIYLDFRTAFKAVMLLLPFSDGDFYYVKAGKIQRSHALQWHSALSLNGMRTQGISRD